MTLGNINFPANEPDVVLSHVCAGVYSFSSFVTRSVYTLAFYITDLQTFLENYSVFHFQIVCATDLFSLSLFSLNFEF